MQPCSCPNLPFYWDYRHEPISAQFLGLTRCFLHWNQKQGLGESSRKALHLRHGNGGGTLSQDGVETRQLEGVRDCGWRRGISGLPSLSAPPGVSKGDAAIRAVTGPPSQQGVSPPQTPLTCPRGPSMSSSFTQLASSQGDAGGSEASLWGGVGGGPRTQRGASAPPPSRGRAPPASATPPRCGRARPEAPFPEGRGAAPASGRLDHGGGGAPGARSLSRAAQQEDGLARVSRGRGAGDRS